MDRPRCRACFERCRATLVLRQTPERACDEGAQLGDVFCVAAGGVSAQVPIWPGVAPDAQPGAAPESYVTSDTSVVAGKQVYAVENVSRPTMTVYLPTGRNTGAVEMHLYAEGGHVFGLRRTKLPITQWPDLVGDLVEDHRDARKVA